MRTIFRATVTAATVILGCVSAHAEIYKFTVKGTVNYTDGTISDVAVGMPFISQFTYDTDTKWWDKVKGDGYESADYQISRKYMFKLTVGPHVLKAVDAAVYVADGNVNQQVDVFDIGSALDARLDGVLCSGSCYFAITLVASPDHADALNSVQLPATLKREKFDRDHYGFISINGGQPTILLDVESVKSTLCAKGIDPRTACDE
jgi:hypothetical protein